MKRGDGRKLRRACAEINAGRCADVVAQFAPQHRHAMAGQHALAGDRRPLAATARWYERLVACGVAEAGTVPITDVR